MKLKIFLFLLGGLFGFLLAALFQPLLRPLLTDLFRSEKDVTEGRVVAKRLQGDRLLITVDATEGTILATFKQRVPEIDLLVQEGDLLKLGVPRYQPFVEDPPILSVRKQEMPTTQERAVEPPAIGIIPPGRGARGAPEPQASEPEAEEGAGAMDGSGEEAGAPVEGETAGEDETSGEAASPEPEASPVPPPPASSASSTAASRP